MLHFALLHAQAAFDGGGSFSLAAHIRTSTALPRTIAQGLCPAGAQHKNASVLPGVSFNYDVQIDLLPEDAGDTCCGITEGNYYTNTLVEPSKKHAGENTYICTSWTPSDPNTPPTFAPGNRGTAPPQPGMHRDLPRRTQNARRNRPWHGWSRWVVQRVHVWCRWHVALLMAGRRPGLLIRPPHRVWQSR